jgi:DNA (cytosine-5)-methyltransferase 1
MDLLMRSAIKIGGQFSGVGAFDSALDRLGIKYDNIYQAEWDKYARLTYLHNHKSPKYYVEDVNNTPIEEITENYGSLDIAMFSPPCQSFSLAGKRLGKDDKRGILFFNSHEFITKNKPRYFIFENVKGLLSDDSGKTFSEWLHLLGGKSVNGMPIVFPYDGAVPYHVYWKVLNAKDFGVPQNRERVFIIGIRDDVDNDFSFPKEIQLTKRLKDVLESEVDEKYYLSEKMMEYFNQNTINNKENGNGFQFKPKTELDINANAITTKAGSRMDDNYIQETPTLKQVGSLYENNSDAGRIYDEEGISCTIKSEGGGLGAKTGLYEVADVITHNMMPRSSTSGKGGTGHLQRNDGIAYCLDTGNTNAVEIVPQSMTKKQLDKFNSIEVDENIAGCITHAIGRAGSSDEYISSIKRNAIITKRIRKLTPRECFRLMDFPDTFDFSVVSNSQAYKQAGNSIVVNVLAQIIKKLKL